MKRLNGYRMRLVLVGFVGVTVLGGENAYPADIWTQKTDMPTPRWMPTSAAVNGRIYVIGGVSSEPANWQIESGEILSTVEEHNPATNRWTRKADMPTARGWIPPSSPVVDGKIYVIGGGAIDDVNWGTSTVEVYDPTTDAWTRKADMPTPRWCLAACALDGKIYAIGGAPNNYTCLTVVEEYDPETDTWTRKANMLKGRWGLCANAVNGKIYAIAGTDYIQANNTVEAYDPATDTWSHKASMPIVPGRRERRNFSTCVVDDKIYAMGGWYASGQYPYSTVQMYDPAIDEWTRKADMPVNRSSLTACAVRGRIFAIGGTNRSHPCPATSTVYEYDTGFIPQLCDFNGDGIVDSDDTRIMVDYWRTDKWLCDIAPQPFGDGIVDAHDLIVLAEYLLFEDVSLVAHWKLEETEGIIAHNSINGKDGTLNSNPAWLPAGGMIGGALQFDGIDDYISTNFVLDPSWGAFSVFAWIKGGAPGQVIISQADGIGTGETWLGMDTVGGNLMTGLVPEKIGWVTPRPLISESVITDIQWHHVGLVWDGSYRALYIDGVEVAKDTAAQNPLKSATGGLYIGASKDLDAGTFFSGLIDDVRIYNQALSAEQITALAQ